MLSTCPNCLNQVNHDHAEIEVKCGECGKVFPTFIKVDIEGSEESSDSGVESQPLADFSAPAEAEPEPAPEPGSPMDDMLAGPLGDDLAAEPAPEDDGLSSPIEPLVSPIDDFSSPAPEEPVPALSEEPLLAEPTLMENDFKESADAFADIRNFGETLQGEIAPVTKSPPSKAPPAPAGMAESQPTAPVSFKDGTEWLMTSGDVLQNHVVSEYLSPVSVLMDLAPGPNPMKPAFEALRAQAKGLGGNAVVAMRWSLSGDATKVLVSGTAVKCVKKA